MQQNGGAMTTVDSKYFSVAGVRLHYLDTGGAGEAIVCLHGTSMTAHCWTDFMCRMRPQCRVVALDQRGHGKSDRPATASYSISEYRDDVIALIENLGLRDVTLVGSSLGTQVAASVASASPTAVRCVILSDPSFYVSAEEVVKYLRSHHLRPRTFPSRDAAERFAMALPQRSGLTPELHRAAMSGDFRDGANGIVSWAYDLAAITKTFLNLGLQDLDELRKIRCPVLILNAENSNVLSPQDASRIHDSIGDSTVRTVAGSNHTIWGDRPAELAEFVADFMRGATNPRRTRGRSDEP